jgi:hypothetical protein
VSQNHSKKTIVYGDLVEEEKTQVQKPEEKKSGFDVKPFAALGDLLKKTEQVKPEIKQETK